MNAENKEVAGNEPLPAAFETRQPVLVELFTSEGCSSCPPADKQLTFLETKQPVSQAEIITLAFHVDYWNQLGWKDEYSSPLYSQRQESYTRALNLDSNYTPQMVVDGETEFVGSNAGKASKAIADAAKIQKGKVETSFDANKLKVVISALPKHENATVFLAIAEDGIVTDVRRGENVGRRLPHTSVVRDLKTVGTIEAGKESFSSEHDVETLGSWKRENLKFVVFVQENASRKIIAAGKLSLPMP